MGPGLVSFGDNEGRVYVLEFKMTDAARAAREKRVFFARPPTAGFKSSEFEVVDWPYPVEALASALRESGQVVREQAAKAAKAQREADEAAGPVSEQASMVMMVTSCSREVAETALEQSNGDVEMAVATLFSSIGFD